MTYIEEFLNANDGKSFVTNLRKYNSLNSDGRKKCISSFITHIFIDAEKGISNHQIQVELLSILNNIILYDNDSFMDWLSEKIN